MCKLTSYQTFAKFADPTRRITDPKKSVLSSNAELRGDTPRAVLAAIMSFLPLKDLLSCRAVDTHFAAAAATAVAVMPAQGPLAGSLFLVYDGDSHRGRRFDQHPPRDALGFICPLCSTSSNITAKWCHRCGATNTVNVLGLRRVFLGQLRKADTTAHAEWLLAMLCPEMTFFHIESHTTKDGKSKGCAWVYVTDQKDTARLLHLDGCCFLDVSREGLEGVWIAPNHRRHAIENLSVDSDLANSRPSVLPTRALVCESPTPQARSKLWHRLSRTKRRAPADTQALLSAANAPKHVQKPLLPERMTQPMVTRHDPYAFAVIAPSTANGGMVTIRSAAFA